MQKQRAHDSLRRGDAQTVAVEPVKDDYSPNPPKTRSATAHSLLPLSLFRQHDRLRGGERLLRL